eukprot:TRINITY_DN3305_c0_g1_i3.p1 TRINITY_DN3305_c0_g1~~TRINITY_DN3305_c0_g1_i3.p1  ORF type:complete len:115 (+),score=17.86 TRINITY_DN3305_c0_g1_i3:128-472(+)
MCIRDRYQRRVRGNNAIDMAQTQDTPAVVGLDYQGHRSWSVDSDLNLLDVDEDTPYLEARSAEHDTEFLEIGTGAQTPKHSTKVSSFCSSAPPARKLVAKRHIHPSVLRSLCVR